MKNSGDSFGLEILRVGAEVEPLRVGLSLIGSVRTAEDPVSELSDLIRTYPAALNALEFLFLLKNEGIPDSDTIALRAKETGILEVIRRRELKDYLAGFFAGSESVF
ncbi:MAG: hypothetical protein JW724_07395 [Candidatus Altiarchaeota archaeon]|nr:hypothetical protein [Candidatus Altiarchaeota archaeon]